MKSILFLSEANRDESRQPFWSVLFGEGYEVTTTPLSDQGVLTAIRRQAPALVLMPIGSSVQVETLQFATRVWQVLGIPVLFIIEEAADLSLLREFMGSLPFGYVLRDAPAQHGLYAVELALHWGAVLRRDRTQAQQDKITAPSPPVIPARSDGAFELDAESGRKEQTNAFIKLLTRAVEQSPASVMITNIRGDIEYVNDKFTQLTGYRFAEVIGRNPSILKSGEMPKQFYQNMWRTILSGGCWSGALHNRRKDGTLYWEHAVIQGISNDQGQVTHLLAVKEDISDRLEAQRRLCDSEAELQAIFENSQVGILLLKHDSLLVKCNQRLAGILGYESPLEMQGMSARQLHLTQEHFLAFGREHYQALSNRETVRVEYQLRRKQGEAVWCSISGKALDRRGPADLSKGVIWVVDEITQRKQAELDLRAANLALREEHELFAGGPVMVFRMLPKPNWPVVYCSENIKSELGYSTESLLRGQIRFSDLLHPRDLQRVSDEVDQALALGTTEFEQEYCMRHADGEYRDFYVFTRLIRDDSGKISMLHGYLLDITIKKLHERENSRIQRELQQARKMEALGQLTGGVAHEFNNMLAVILGHTSLIGAVLGSQADGKILTYLRHIENAGNRSRDLVRQMLSYSRTDETAARRIQPAPLVQEIVSLARAMLPSSIEIAYRAEAQVPDIQMDPGALQQILMNLFVNARDAMRDKGGLGIGLRFAHAVSGECNSCHTRLQGDWVELTVEDSGEGIPPDVIERVFEPFFTTKSVGKGTGLGLSVVQGLTERLGGHIMIHSQLGRGSRFRLLFPPIREPHAQPSTEKPRERVDRAVQLSGRVWVVDDEAAIVELLREILQEHGLQVFTMTNSPQALALLEDPAQVCDLLIADQTMPGLTGQELVEAARRVRPNLRVILCSGHSERLNAENASRYGIDCFLQKPINIKLLRERVESLLGTCQRCNALQ